MKKQNATQKAVNNGTARVLSAVKDEPQKGKSETPKAQGKRKEENPPLPEKVVTAEQRMENLERMNVIANRHKLLKGKEKEFFDFQNADDRSNSRLLLSNGAGLSFEVTNSEVIDITVKTLQGQLDGKIKETEKELLEFQV